MRALLLACALSIAMAGPGDGQTRSSCGLISDQPPLASFTARVEWIEMAGARKVVAIPIDLDARWLVGVEILSFEKPAAPLVKGHQVLLVHSPTVMFAATPGDVIGQLRAFCLYGEMRDGVPHYLFTAAVPFDTKGAASGRCN